MSIVTVARLAGAHVGEVEFLRVGVDPKSVVRDDGEHRLAGGRDAAELDLIDLRRLAGDRRGHARVLQIALRVLDWALAWM